MNAFGIDFGVYDDRGELGVVQDGLRIPVEELLAEKRVSVDGKFFEIRHFLLERITLETNQLRQSLKSPLYALGIHQQPGIDSQEVILIKQTIQKLNNVWKTYQQTIERDSADPQILLIISNLLTLTPIYLDLDRRQRSKYLHIVMLSMELIRRVEDREIKRIATKLKTWFIDNFDGK